MISTIFYDLDGTLLPMKMEEFTSGYFKYLAEKAALYGINTEKIVPAIWAGTKRMVLNDGSRINEDVFWDFFCSEMNISIEMKSVFDDFYRNEFEKAKKFCGYNDKVPALIKTVKELGLRQVLATNPIFPETATRKRAAWAGVSVEDFETFTTYENCHYCKPNVKYYEELMAKIGVTAQEVIMIGNDVEEDIIPAEKLGMKAFLVTDCMINAKERDISVFNHGDFDAALEFIRANAC